MLGSTPNPSDSDRGAAVVSDETATAAPLPAGVFCVDCGYDLRGLTSERCPECGVSIVELHGGQSLIPWVHRKHVGFWRAYWKTVWLVFRQPKTLALEMVRKVDWGDSQSFRWTTTAIAYACVLLATLTWYACHYVYAWPISWETPWLFAYMNVAAAVLLAIVPGMTSCIYYSPLMSVEQENRAIALSYYTCAPLAFMPIPMGLMLVGTAFWSPVALTPSLLRAIGIVAAATLFFIHSECNRGLMYRIPPLKYPGRWKRTLLWNAAGLVLVALLFFGGPILIFWALVVYHSLQ